MGIRSRLMQFCFVTLRIKKYRLLSDCRNVTGNPKTYQPVLTTGLGSISFGTNVQMGVRHSKDFFSGYIYIEARGKGSSIAIGNNVSINNNFTAVAMSQIVIGDNVLIGDNCTIEDSDGHSLHPDNRQAEGRAKPVIVGKNVFLGSNVVVLKGLIIGENSVIGNSSVVTKDIPANVVAAGNPARVIRSLI